jgi:hypothetical protein
MKDTSETNFTPPEFDCEFHQAPSGNSFSAMLTRSRLASALRRPALARNLCAPAVPLVDQVRADLAVMKAKISQKTVGGYTTEAFSAALSKGTVDPTLLSASMDFSDEARKVG